MNSFWIFISPWIEFSNGYKGFYFIKNNKVRGGGGNKVNIEFYGKIIGTVIPRPALFLTCLMTVKLILDQKTCYFCKITYVHYIAGSRVHAVGHISTSLAFFKMFVDEK